MTIREAFVRYDQDILLGRGKSEKTRANYRAALNSFTKHVGDIPVQLVTLDHFTLWLGYMGSYGMQPSSQASNLSRVKEILKYMRIIGLDVLDSRDVVRPSVPRKQYTWLSFQEVHSILDVIESPRDKAIVACLFSTGCRVSELLNLNRDDIKDGEAVVMGKGNKLRTVYFDKTALEALESYFATRKDKLTPLFVSGQYRRITVSRVEQLLHIYSDQAGVNKNVTPHVLRHSYASDLKKNGAGIYDIKELLGHSQISTTMIYSHVNQEYNRSKHNEFHST